MEDRNTSKLNRLATLFAPHSTLYLVGGCVRDKLLGTVCFDIDICSKLTVDEVKRILLNTDFVVSDKCLRMGTVHISSDDFVAEYTTFRTDSYDRDSGKHHPDQVKFTDDILLDARRRDFKCNALYEDILTGKIVDVTGGLQDIKNKVISTADDAQNVFEADGLRILRMVRFASELGFEIEAHTFDVAKQNAWRVKDLAVERIREELCKIFVADTKHKELILPTAHVKGLRLLDELGLVDMLLPELSALKGLEQPKKYHLYDAYEHSVKAYEVAPQNIRFCALMHDIGKAEAVKRYGNMHGHDVIGAEMMKSVCDRLKFSTAYTKRAVRLVRWHMVDLAGDMSENKLRRFVAKNMDIVDDLCALMRADAIASCGRDDKENRIALVAKDLKEDGTPLCIKDLKVSGDDLVRLGIEEKDRGKVLNALWEDTVMNPSLNDRNKALDYIERMNKKLKEGKEK